MLIAIAPTLSFAEECDEFPELCGNHPPSPSSTSEATYACYVKGLKVPFPDPQKKLTCSQVDTGNHISCPGNFIGYVCQAQGTGGGTPTNPPNQQSGQPAPVGGSGASTPPGTIDATGKSQESRPPGTQMTSKECTTGSHCYFEASGKMYEGVGCSRDGKHCSSYTPLMTSHGDETKPSNTTPDEFRNAVGNSSRDCAGTCSQLGRTLGGPNGGTAVAGGGTPGEGKTPDGKPADGNTASGGGGANGGGGGNSATDQEGIESYKRDEQTAKENGRAGYDTEEASVRDGNPDDCGTSNKINGSYGCSGARMFIEGAKVTNALTQTAGSVATAAIGQGQQQAAMAEGTQSAALMAAANTARTSGTIQVTAGATNGLMGAIQLMNAFSHKGNIGSINSATQKGAAVVEGFEGGKLRSNKVEDNSEDAAKGKERGQIGHMASAGGKNKDTDSAISSFNLQAAELKSEITISEEKCKSLPVPQQAACTNARNAQIKSRMDEIKSKQSRINGKLAQIGSNAVAEQQKIYQDSMAGGMMSLITGAGQGVSGAFAIASADQLEEAANRMKDIENTQFPTPGFTPLGPSSNAPADPLAPGNGQAITGQTEAPAQQASNDEGGVPDLGGLGKPLGTDQPNKLDGNGPAPGGFQAGGPTGGGGGGSGGGMGGGSVGTSPAAADPGEPQAKMADGSKGAGYEGGGSYGGGGAGSGAASNGPDLSGLLAQFLPKKEDEQKNPNGILDFGGRGPASEGPISLLDRNANIFDRIHETYQDKNRKGKVGI